MVLPFDRSDSSDPSDPTDPSDLIDKVCDKVFCTLRGEYKRKRNRVMLTRFLLLSRMVEAGGVEPPSETK